MHRWVPLVTAVVLACGPGEAVSPPTASPPGRTGAFDRGVAASVLMSVDLKGCRDKDGPKGKFHVKTTFAPDGKAKAAAFDSAGHQGEVSTAIAGTPRGDCVLEKFRALEVQPFDPPDVAVGRMITLD